MVTPPEDPWAKVITSKTLISHPQTRVTIPKTQGGLWQDQFAYSQLYAQIWTLQRRQRAETVKVPMGETAAAFCPIRRIRPTQP